MIRNDTILHLAISIIISAFMINLPQLYPAQTWWQVYFTSPENQTLNRSSGPEQGLVRFIKSSHRTLYAAFYDLSSEPVTKALVQAKKLADIAIAKDDLPQWKDKKKGKELADSIDFLVVQAQHMQPLATTFGQVLGPRGKMPNPAHIVPPVSDITKIVNRARNSVRVRLKESPVIQTYVGSEDMDDEKLADNIEAVVKLVTKKLIKGENNIKNVVIKSTMGPAVKFNV